MVFIVIFELAINAIEQKGTTFTLTDLLLKTANLLIFSPQVKILMILTHINLNPRILLKFVTSKVRIWPETHP